MHVCKKYPDAVGGDAVVVSNLRAQQEAAGHDVTIVTSNCREITAGRRIYKCGLRHTPAQLDAITPRRLLSLFYLFFRMFRLLRKERPDVIHTHSVDMAFCVALAARFFQVPIVHTFHIVTFYDESQALIRRGLELWLARRTKARAITAPNSFDVRKLQAAGLMQSTLLPNGVNLGFWQSDDSSCLQEEEKTVFTFIAVGRLERQKGYSYLVEAASLLLKASDQPFKIVIVGEGSQEAMLRARVRSLGLLDVVQFVGGKSMTETRDLLRCADAAVLSSLYETTPLTLLEAWATGVPVIATRTGILRETLADFAGAYTVAAQDSHALMQAMQRCMQDARLRRSVADNGHLEVQQYTWPAIASRAERIYRSVR